MGILEWFQKRYHGSPTWPPSIEIQAHWDNVQTYRRHASGEAAELIPYNTFISRNPELKNAYTPIPMGREMTALSSSLLFSAPIKVILPEEEEAKRAARKEKQEREKAARNPFVPTPSGMVGRDIGQKPPDGAKTDTKASPGSADPRTPDEDNATPSVPERETEVGQTRRQKLLEELLDVNGIDAFLQESGERVAGEGRGAIRIIRDDEVAEGKPYMTYVPEDQILWKELHGRAVVGGAVVLEHLEKTTLGESTKYYRLMEEHTKGLVERTCYLGTFNRLGQKIAPASWPEHWRTLLPRVTTGLDQSTLIRWDNTPGGTSDLQQLIPLLQRLDEAETLMTDKGRKSVPIVVADAEIANEDGKVEIHGAILRYGEGGVAEEFGKRSDAVEVKQPGLESQAHLEWVSHVREMIATHAGYSAATWGIGEAGRSDSGTALALRQARTLLTRAGKDRMAREAIQNAIAVALCWLDGGSKVSEYRPEVTLGDGLPEDSAAKAEEIAKLKQAGVISLRQAIRELHSDWSEDQVDDELEAIEGGQTPPPELDPAINPILRRELENPPKDDEEPKAKLTGGRKPIPPQFRR